MKIYSLDTESYYDANLSIVTMGAWHYTRASDCYMLTVAGEDGYRYVGHPKDFNWSILRGACIVMANAAYDLTVLEAEGEKGNIPTDLGFAEVVDVLDMARYLGRPGNLAGATESLLGGLYEGANEVSKATRSAMKGKRWEDMTPEFKEEVKRYALDDAKWTLLLWQVYNDKWPWWEKELSRQTREMCMRGLPIDVDRAKEYEKHLKQLLWEAEQSIPWARETDAKILSPKALAEECRKVGIEPPKSLAQDSEECAAWEDKYGEQYPWVGAMRDYRRCNMLLTKVQTFIRRTKPDGWVPYGLKYFGSGATGRWSGDSGLSLLNLPRAEMYGVDLRSLICAPEGWSFVISDFSSLEPRAANWIVGATKMLELLADPSVDLYEAHARAYMNYTDPRPLKQYDKEEGTEIRKLSKARVLGAGYGASGAKFVLIAKVMADLDLSAAEANKAIEDFRRQNPGFVNTWKKLDAAMKRCAGRSDFTMEIPSGRVISYFAVSNVGDGLSAVTCRNGKMMRSRWWGSKIFENLVQSTAREILGEKLLQTELEHGVLPCLHVHDEIVLLVPTAEAEEKKALLERVMSEAPSFMAGLPLAAEAQISTRYTK